MTAPPSNPFATRWIRPGEVPFVFPEDAALDQCLKRLLSERRLQIIGPHGSGKSTMVRRLLSELPAEKASSRLIRIGPEGRIEEALAFGDLSRHRLDCIDGWERMSRVRRTILRLSASRLLVTTHRDVGWPVLAQLRPTAELACRLARFLQQQQRIPQSEMIDDQTVVACFRRCGGNLRESLFALYDIHERRRAPQA